MDSLSPHQSHGIPVSASPDVSVCIPCLNAGAYLGDCLRSIEAQIDIEWELIVCDGFSSDGSWELLQQFCDNHPRCRCFQSSAPLYDAWNEAIRLAEGRYIYIATSDDAIAAGALCRMVAALDANVQFGVCQIRLVLIDHNGKSLLSCDQWVNGRLSFYDSRFTSTQNQRLAPHDGVLMAGFHTIYESVNQLLIRRVVFERVGYFDSSFGSMGDFEWGMRVGLLENCFYLPEPVAFWRKHPGQLTQPAFTPAERLVALEMTRTAFRRAVTVQPLLPAALLRAMEDIIYDDYVAAIVQQHLPKKVSIPLLFSEIRSRPRLMLRRLFRALLRLTTTTFDYPRKRHRLLSLMRQFSVPEPRYLS